MASTRGRGRRNRRAQRRPSVLSYPLPYTRRNALVFAVGLGVILLGYFFLAQPPVDGALSLLVAPILLVIGYCVLVPLALLLGSASKQGGEAPTEDAEGG